MTEDKINDFVVVNILKIHAAYSKSLLSATFYPPYSAFTKHLPEFEVIVDLSSLIYPYLVKDTGSNFHFDLGIVAPLNLVALKCSDHGVRRRAIELLCRTPGYREGIWDAMAMGRAAEAALNDSNSP